MGAIGSAYFGQSFIVIPLDLFSISFLVGMSNHARLDILRFESGIRIHPKVRIVSTRIYETMFSWYITIYKTIL